MSKLDNALYQIHSIDNMAARDQWVNNMHPLVKLVLTVMYIALVVSFSKYDLAGLLRMGVYPIAVFILGEISFKDSLRRLRVVLPVVCVVGLFNPFFDRKVIMQVGGIYITGGIISMVTLIVKGFFCVLASYLLIASTSIEKICYSLRRLHIPRLMVTQILLTFRYITIILEEANRIFKAYALRAPRQKGVHFRVWGTFAGQILLRSMDKANAVHESMTLRGYHGDFYYHKTAVKISDICYLVIWLVIFFMLRII